MGVKAGPRIVKEGLVFDTDVAVSRSYSGSGITVYDIETSSIGGTLVNGVTYSSNYLGYFSFDGTNDYILVPSSFIPTGNEVTICLWNYGTVAVAQSVFSAMLADNSRVINLHLPWSDSIVYWDAGSSAGSYDRINTAALSNSQWQGWHFWSCVKNASTGVMEIYLDGLLNVSGTSKTRTLSTTYEAYIGKFQVTSSLYHNGGVAQFLIYNRALTAKEILQNYNATKRRYGL